MQRRFRWGLALSLTVAIAVPLALVMAVTAFLFGLAIILGPVAATAVAFVCLSKGRDNPTADAVGFAMLAAPLLIVAPFLVYLWSYLL